MAMKTSKKKPCGIYIPAGTWGEGSMYTFCHGSVRFAHWSKGLLQSQQKQYLTEQGLGFYRKYIFRLQKAEKFPLEYRNYKYTMILLL